MKKKELKLFNGRPYGVLPVPDWAGGSHIYVAAYSIADARRVCVEAGYSDPGAYEISKYWNKDAWGNRMDGVPVSRGLWVTRGHFGKPEFLGPKA